MCALLLALLACMVSSNYTRDNMVKRGMYFPITFNSEKPPTYFCYHFRKLCYGKFMADHCKETLKSFTVLLKSTVISQFQVCLVVGVVGIARDSVDILFKSHGCIT